MFSDREVGMSPSRRVILSVIALLVYLAGSKLGQYCERQKAASVAASPAQAPARKQGSYLLPVEITVGSKRPRGW